MLRAIEQPYTDNSERKAYQIPPMESERVRQTFCGTEVTENSPQA